MTTVDCPICQRPVEGLNYEDAKRNAARHCDTTATNSFTYRCSCCGKECNSQSEANEHPSLGCPRW